MVMNKFPMNNPDCTKCAHCNPTDEPHVWECDAKDYNLNTFDCYTPRPEVTEDTSLATERGGGC